MYANHTAISFCNLLKQIHDEFLITLCHLNLNTCFYPFSKPVMYGCDIIAYSLAKKLGYERSEPKKVQQMKERRFGGGWVGWVVVGRHFFLKPQPYWRTVWRST